MNAVFLVTASLFKPGDKITSYKINPEKRLLLALGEKDAESYMREKIENDPWILENKVQIKKITVKRIPVNGINPTDKYKEKHNL